MSIDKNGFGPLLVMLGLVLFLGNIGLFHFGSFFAAMLLATIGVFFYKNYNKNKKHLWSFLLAFGFFALVAAILNPAMSGTSLFLVMALGFLMVYKNNHEHWWAIIPAGSLFSLAAVTASQERFTLFSNVSGALFLFGLAATFGYLYFELAKKWAIFPAASLVIVAILTLSLNGGWLLPLAIIIVGLYMVKNSQGVSHRDNEYYKEDKTR